jgi:hypothetical protein
MAVGPVAIAPSEEEDDEEELAPPSPQELELVLLALVPPL